MYINRGLALVLVASLLAASPSFAQLSSCPGGPSSSFRVEGQVQHSLTINYWNFLRWRSSSTEPIPVTTVQDFFVSGSGTEEGEFTGVLLWDLLNYAGLVINPNEKNDIYRKYVVITGTDCYQGVFSMGELAPEVAGATQPIVAFELNGQPLPASDGFARIISPGDKIGARRINNITDIQVFSTDQ